MLTEIINAARELSQGGIVFILVAIICALMYACSALFKAYTTNNERMISVLEDTAKTVEANTQLVEKGIQVSEANKAAVESLIRALLERRSTRS